MATAIAKITNCNNLNNQMDCKNNKLKYDEERKYY
jgi:hypothetical protein